MVGMCGGSHDVVSDKLIKRRLVVDDLLRGNMDESSRALTRLTLDKPCRIIA